MGIVWLIIYILTFGALAYHRASLIIWTLSYALLTVFFAYFSGLTFTWWLFTIVAALILVPLNVKPLRRLLISRRVLAFYRRVMPAMSRTEREAISSGTVSWDRELFCGAPDWDKLLAYPKAKLSQEEIDFLNGPVETLCKMLDDWDITHHRLDMPQEVWDFLKRQGFFGLIIPKQYGGKEFSAYAHSQVLIKVNGRSITAASTIAVPNSLGPAELLLHYGTADQKNYYLPRLAKGEDIPCFALTSPEAGSDAGSMTDNGVVCYGEYHGEKVLGIRLNWDKRYITLAPVATVIGLAFKLYDPDHLIGNEEDVGITCALIPRQTPGITIGRRHFALNAPFQNGPIVGKNVFIPLDAIIGGVSKAGKGWVMLMECLAAGRAISLPASAVGGAKVLCYTGGAYARVRKQFNTPIGKFEGIEEPLARIGGYTYIMDSARTFAASLIDQGEKPSVISAMVKYHVTELGRKLACDGMDIFGGKGICLGPKNIFGRGYEAAPIAITVEGANILTRNMIIFGQGAIRCHPYVLPEMEAAKITDPHASLVAFDNVLFKHIAFGISNVVRSFVLGITGSYIVKAPPGELKRYYQHATRFSSAFALFTDVAMGALGGSLKRKESLSARLGDILSYLYLLSAVFKQYQDEGSNQEDLPVVRFACFYCLYNIQERFADLIDNFPNKALAWMLKVLIFPIGQRFPKPKDTLNHKISNLLMAPTGTRSRLAEGIYLAADKVNTIADFQDALVKAIAADPVEKMIRTAKMNNQISGLTPAEQAEDALQKGIIDAEQFDVFMQAEKARKKIIAVDDFSNEQLARNAFEESLQNIYANSDGTHG